MAISLNHITNAPMAYEPQGEALTAQQRKEYIAALLTEREGYARYGRDDQVAEVDAELKRVGYQATAPAKRAVKMQKKAGLEA